ncbi:MAG: hypothetical protein ACFFDX_02855 [Candidatus Odinarchaeota archaeon]
MSDLIIIDITENEKLLLDGSLNLKEIKGNGNLSVKNPSNKSRLWNLICDLKEIVNTTIDSRELNVGILNPSQEYTKDYEIQNLKQSSLIVNEEFDTQRDINYKLNNVFLFKTDNKSSIKITLTNPFKIPISNIKLSREIPSFIQEIEIKAPNVGIAGVKEELGSRTLEWVIVNLDGNQTAELTVFCNVNVKDKEKKALGTLNISYLINNYKLTLLNPEIRGLTDSMSGIDRDEGAQPGSWDCEVEFINESEFQVKLEDVKVKHKIITGMETVVSQTPNRLLNPEQSWTYNFQVDSKDVPELSSTIEFTPLFVVITRVFGEINKESTIYPVLTATIEKVINPPEVDAYANTDIQIENVIANNGSSTINSIRIIDNIPQDFICPLLSQITINLHDIDISSRTDFTNKIEIDPSDQNPETQHTITIELFNLSDQFLPNSKLNVKYPLIAKNPRPPTETLYKTPVKIEVNSPVEGKYYVDEPLDEPEIKVKFVKRKLKTLKSIKPGISEGEFSISVLIQNKGNVELENILIKDKIPKGFNLSQIEIDAYEVNQLGEESELQVKIAELKGNNSFILNYSCSGQGEYPRYESEVIVQGREGLDQTPEAPIQTLESSSLTETKVSEISIEKKAEIHELFNAIFKKVDQTITGNDLSIFIEGMRDKIPPGLVLHQFMQFAREIRTSSAEKIIVGSLRDKVLTKLKEFKDKFT